MPAADGQISMAGQVHVFAVNRHEEFGLCPGKHTSFSSSWRRDGNVNVRCRIPHLRAFFSSSFTHADYVLFVAGRTDALMMILSSVWRWPVYAHCWQYGQVDIWFPHACDDNQLFIPIILDFVDINKKGEPGRPDNPVQTLFYGVYHTSADDGNFSAVHIGRVDDLLDMVNIRENVATMIRFLGVSSKIRSTPYLHSFQTWAFTFPRWCCRSWEQYALTAQFRKTLQVDDIPVSV